MRTSILLAMACVAAMAIPTMLAPSVAAEPVGIPGPIIVIGSVPALNAPDLSGYTEPVLGVGDVALDAGCDRSTTNLHGYVNIPNWGLYAADGGYSDGCGGHGCDDTLWGTYYTRRGSFGFGIVEQYYKDRGCYVTCWIYTSSSSSGYHHFDNVPGYVQPAFPAPNGAIFGCGTRSASGGAFTGCFESTGTYCEKRMGVSTDTGVELGLID
jgi:hypothetical protein